MRIAEPVRAVVVDDEPAARAAIVTLLAGEPRIRVIAQAANGRDAIDVIREVEPDLIFLDVQMPDLDGFGVLDALGGDAPAGVIFVTAHDEHAIRAFEVHALDYLLKPFGRPRFRSAVERALERLAARHALTVLETRAARTSATAPDPGAAWTLDPAAVPSNVRRLSDRIAVRNGGRTTLVDTERIDWIEACGDYVRLHVGGESYLLAGTMNQLERRLDGARFARVHRSVIVNLERVRQLDREADGSGSLLLDRGIRLRVARGRWDDLERALGIHRD